jgi:hypothetical protein
MLLGPASCLIQGGLPAIEGETAVMKWIVNLVFKDLLTQDFSELLESWALMFAIVPFGALIFCGMYVGQFILNSTVLGVLLMFVFPVIGFAVLYAIRKAIATSKNTVRPARQAAPDKAEVKLDSPLVVVRIEGTSENGKRPMYTLRRMNALENVYVQKGMASSVAALRAEFGEQYPDIEWSHIVADPPKSLATSMQRTEGHTAEPVQPLSR